jgi:hypothetical protein
MSSRSGPQIERRVRAAGVLVVAGLAIQMATIAWNHPLAFIGFLAAGTPLIGAGVLLYLLSVPGMSGSRRDDGR